MDLDETDRTLLALLRQDARLTVATLAQKTGVSRGTVANRLRIRLVKGIANTETSILLATYR